MKVFFFVKGNANGVNLDPVMTKYNRYGSIGYGGYTGGERPYSELEKGLHAALPNLLPVLNETKPEGMEMVSDSKGADLVVFTHFTCPGCHSHFFEADLRRFYGSNKVFTFAPLPGSCGDVDFRPGYSPDEGFATPLAWMTKVCQELWAKLATVPK